MKVKSSCCLLLLLLASLPSAARSAPEALFNPPGWIMGEWVTLSESNLNRLQTLVFASHEIKLTRGFGRGSKLMEFSREFKGSVVKETFEPGLYRVEISRDKNVYVYEFKLCPKEVCHSTSKEALTYSVIKNKELIRGHWTSINLVLFRPIGVE